MHQEDSRTIETKTSPEVQTSSIDQTECEPEKITDGPVCNKEIMALRKTKRLNKYRKCIKSNDLKAELRSCNIHLRYSEQRMGDISVMIKVSTSMLSIIEQITNNKHHIRQMRCGIRTLTHTLIDQTINFRA